MVDIEKLTNYSKEILFASGALMNKYKNAQIQPEHIMLAMIQDNGIAKDYLQELKLLNEDFIKAVVYQIKSYPTLSNIPSNGQIYLSDDTQKILDIAEKQSNDFKDEFISIESILLAMTNLMDSSIQKLLKAYNVTDKQVLNAMKKIRGNKKVDNKNAEENMQALAKFSTDLTELAKKGKLDPVVGRDEEIRRIIQVLNRRTKNNPI